MLQTEHTLQSFATDIEQCTLHSALHTVEMLQTEHTSPGHPSGSIANLGAKVVKNVADMHTR